MGSTATVLETTTVMLEGLGWETATEGETLAGGSTGELSAGVMYEGDAGGT